MLAALVERDGGIVDFPGLVRDEREAILEALHADADVVIVSGGSSVGIEDLAPMLVARHGELAVHGIAMRPSSPDRPRPPRQRLVFLLPGNPVSSLCAYDFFAGRAIRALGGRPTAWPYRSVRGTLTRKISSPIGRLDYARVEIADGLVEPLSIGGASLLSSTTRADGFVIVGDDSEGFRRRRRRRGLALCVSRSSSSRSSIATKPSAASAPPSISTPRGIERVPLDAALGRVLAADVVSPVDVPSFDRSNVDGFAVVAEDTFGASEENPAPVRLAERRRFTPASSRDASFGRRRRRHRHRRHDAARRGRGRHGRARRRARPTSCASRGPSPPAAASRLPAPTSPPAKPCFAAVSCSPAATPACSPRSASPRSTSGASRSSPSSRPATRSSRPASPMQPARSTTRTRRCSPTPCASWAASRGVSASSPDDVTALREACGEALDVRRRRAALGRHQQRRGRRVVSRRRRARRSRDRGARRRAQAGQADLPRRDRRARGRRAARLSRRRPSSPSTSSWRRCCACWRAAAPRSGTVVPARLAVKVNSEIGRTEYLLVGLVEIGRRHGDAARGVSDGTGVRQRHDVQPRRRLCHDRPARGDRPGRDASSTCSCSGRDLQLADLVVIGSHCIGLDYLLGELQRRGVRSKFLAVGSTGGLEAAKRGECDVAGVHLLDPDDRRVQPAVPDAGARARSRLRPPAGHRLPPRRHALRRPHAPQEAIAAALRDPACVMVNRNQGSGTRALIDRLLARRKAPPAMPCSRATTTPSRRPWSRAAPTGA